MVRRALAVAIAGASLAACGQLLGIQAIQDDPTDASTADVAVAPGQDGGAPEASADARDDVAADAPPPVDATLDSGLPEAGPTGAALGCSSPDGAPSTFPLGSTDRHPAALAIDDGGIYISDSLGVRRCTLDGCPSGVSVVSSTPVLAFTTDDTHVVYCTKQNVVIATSNGTKLASYVDWESCGSVASRGAALYWANQAGNGRVLQGSDPVSGGPANTVVNDSFGPAIALAPTSQWLFFMERDVDAADPIAHVVRCDLPQCDGGANVIGTSAPGTTSFEPPLAANERTAFWGDPSAKQLLACDVSGCDAGASVLVGDASVSAIYATEGDVYWTDIAGGVHKTPLDGGATVTVATGQYQPEHVIANAACIYWTASGTIEGGQSGVLAVRQP